MAKIITKKAPEDISQAAKLIGDNATADVCSENGVVDAKTTKKLQSLKGAEIVLRSFYHHSRWLSADELSSRFSYLISMVSS